MTKEEVFAAIKNLVKPTESVEEVKFERVALEGGEVFITNQTEGELALGDTIYVEEGSEFILAPSGTHRLEDGREIVLDEESALVEIKEESEVEEEVVEEEVVEAGDDEEMNAQTQIEELKTAIHDLLMAFESHIKDTDERFNTLKADYENFKKEAEYTPVKQDNSFKAKFSALEARMAYVKENKH